MKKYRKIALFLQIMGLLIFIVPTTIAFFIPGTENPNWFLLHFDIILFVAVIMFFVCEMISLVMSFIFWRCGYCNHGFPIRWGAMDRAVLCPFCGNKLE